MRIRPQPVGQSERRLSKSNRAFLFLLPVAVLFAISIIYVSERKLQKEADCGCSMPPVDATGEYDSGERQAVFNNQILPPEFAYRPVQESLMGTQVLGENTDEKWIEIDLSEQTLYAHNGGNVDYQFLVSTGKWAPTPTGEYRIWIKLKYTKMSGGNKANNTYYYLPNVPYTQYFYKGFGLHGAYWHSNFGQPMSHGCVNLAIPDAEKLFYWTSPPVEEKKGTIYPTKGNPGTRIVIHE